MKQYIITIILALCLGSCGQDSKHWEMLARVEPYIEESPDSALCHCRRPMVHSHMLVKMADVFYKQAGRELLCPASNHFITLTL